MARKIMVHMYITPELKETLEDLAAAEGRHYGKGMIVTRLLGHILRLDPNPEVAVEKFENLVIPEAVTV